MKRIFCSLLTIILLFSCTACADWDELSNDPLQELSQYYQAENEPQKNTELYAFALPYSSNETLDGVTCSDGLQQVVGKLLYESLYELDAAFEPQPLLAAGYHYDAESFTYTIEIRGDVCFSDGSPLTARDVVETLNRAMQSTRYSSRLNCVERISGSGNTVIIRLLEPNGGFIRLLDIPMVKSGTETQKVPLGTGPYAIARDDSGNYLAPNPFWWQNKPLPLRRIELVPCKSNDAASYAFTAQNVQLLRTDLIGTNTISADISGTCVDAPDTVLQYLGFNFGNEFLLSSKVRHAISCAIDRENLVSTYLLGHACAAQFPLPPAIPSYPHEKEQSYNRETVDSAMKTAGLNSGGEKIPLTLLVNEENHFKVAIATEIARVLNQYDLSVQVQTLPWEDFLTALVYGQYDLYYGEARLLTDWNLSALVGSGGSLNFGGFSYPQTDELLQAYLEAQGEQRDAILSDLCENLQEMQPIAPICFKNISVLATNNAVDNLSPTAGNPFYHMENWVIHLAKP